MEKIGYYKRVVKPGDTLWSICRIQCYNTMEEVLKIYNDPANDEFRKKFPDPNKIQPDAIFYVPYQKGKVGHKHEFTKEASRPIEFHFSGEQFTKPSNVWISNDQFYGASLSGEECKMIIPREINNGIMTLSFGNNEQLSYNMEPFLNGMVGRQPLKLYLKTFDNNSFNKESTGLFTIEESDLNTETIHMEELTGVELKDQNGNLLKDTEVEVEKLSDKSVNALHSWVYAFIKVTAETSIDIITKREMLRELGLKKFRVNTIKGVDYISFKGNPKLRPTYKGTRYSLDNPKIMGVEALRTVNRAKVILKSAKLGAVTVFIEGAVDAVQWAFLPENEKNMSDLLVTIGMDLAKAAISQMAATMIVSASVTFLFSLFPTLAAMTPVGLVFLGTIGVGIIIGSILDSYDENQDLTKSVQKLFKQ